MQNTADTTVEDGFQFKLSLFYATLFFSIGCYLPYFPLWLQGAGLEPEKIGVVLAAPAIMRILFTPVISVWADYLRNYRLVLVVLALGSLGALFSLNFVSGFWAILLIATINGIFWTSIVPLTETLAMVALDGGKLNYGRARSWGSVSFIVGSLGAGALVDYAGNTIVLPLLVLSGTAIVIAAFILPRPVGRGRLRRAVTAVEGEFDKAGILALFRHPVFWIFLVAAGLGQACHAFYYGFSTVHWRSIGYSGWLIGTLWALGVVAEILLFLLLGSWLRRFNAGWLILAGSAAATLRWGVTAFDPPLGLLVPVQVLHALSFGVAHLGAVYFIAVAVPKQFGATAQGLYATMSAGIFMGGAILASGPLYEAIGAYGYLVMAGVAFVSALLALLLLARWDGGRLSGAPAAAFAEAKAA